MEKIITLTVNPAIDKSTKVEGIKPERKLRCDVPVFEAGGGGINVSKVLDELGGASLCMYLAGGPTGSHLKELLLQLGIRQHIIPVQGWVRENLSVTDTLNNQQYRFGMPGPEISETEWKNALAKLEAVLLHGDILVASGSLSPGIPTDFYARVAAIAQHKKTRLILDTSGEALKLGATTGAYLLKPNLGELATLCGLKTISFKDLRHVAKSFLEENPCEVMVVSLGAQGALLVQKNREAATYITAPVVPRKSTIGAGDSMVAGMAFSLAKGRTPVEMARYGVACGTAATMSEGTQLCKKKDVEALYLWLEAHMSDAKNIKINA